VLNTQRVRVVVQITRARYIGTARGASMTGQLRAWVLLGVLGAAAGQLSCVQCPLDRYLDSSTPTTLCTSCPLDSSRIGYAASTVEDCKCNAGYTRSTGSTGSGCAQCARGTFKGDVTDNPCTSCNTNSNTPATGATDLVDCVCIAGFYLFIQEESYVAQNPIPTGDGIVPDSVRLIPSGIMRMKVFRDDMNQNIIDTASVYIIASPPATGPGPAPRYLYKRTNSLSGIEIGDFNRDEFIPGSQSTSGNFPGFQLDTTYRAYIEIFDADGTKINKGTEFSAISTPENKQYGECVYCEAGTFKGHLSNDACEVCDVDTFCVEGSVSEQSCTDFSQALSGSKEIADCECNTGYTLNTAYPDTLSSADYTCVPCEAGMYKDTTGSTPCEECPANKYNEDTGSDAVGDCRDCDTNSASPTGSAAVTACKCNIGYSGIPGAECLECAAGKYRADVFSYICTPCAVNTYNVESGMDDSNACIDCGETTSTQGASGQASGASCVCNAGYETTSRSTVDPSECSECVVGKYQPPMRFVPPRLWTCRAWSDKRLRVQVQCRLSLSH